jgi:hypothetical protein
VLDLNEWVRKGEIEVKKNAIRELAEKMVEIRGKVGPGLGGGAGRGGASSSSRGQDRRKRNEKHQKNFWISLEDAYENMILESK